MSKEIILVSIPKEELQTLIIDSVKACLKFNIPKLEADELLPELMTRKQVADYLSISLTTVDTLTRDGTLKKYFIGGSPRFKREEVRAVADTWKPYNRKN